MSKVLVEDTSLTAIAEVITIQLNGENTTPLIRDEYLTIIEQLVKEDNSYKGEF